MQYFALFRNNHNVNKILELFMNLQRLDDINAVQDR